MADSNAGSGAAFGDLQEELRTVDLEIEQARRSALEARRAIGDHSEGAVDAVDRSSAIEQAEEQERLVDVLSARRETLLERIRAAAG
jgi:hypothetical protein